jgi:SAM-dependent methyltransferase
MMDRYIQSGDKILDIGGGPGRYSLYYANKGCDVTLVDLSSGNVEFALNKALEMNVNIKGFAGDAREVDKIVEGTFDHVFIMGPMYHLLEEGDRIKAINAALSLLKEGGKVYISFIFMFAGMIFGMKDMPEMLLLEDEKVFVDCVVNDQSYGGDAFTKAFFISKKDIMPFMEKFPLERMHLFGQEGILAPCEKNILAQPQEVIDKWVEVAEKLCERDDLLSYSEHVMYIGRKL